MGGARRFADFKSKLERRLLLPYFVANFAWYPIWFICSYCLGFLQYFQKSDEPFNLFIAIFIGNNDSFGTHLMITGPTWFLPCLMFAELIFLKLYSIRNRQNFFKGIIILSFVGYLLRIHFQLPLGLDISLVTLVFVLVGNLLRKNDIIDKLNFKFCLILTMLFFVAYQFNGFIDMNRRSYSNLVLFFIGGITGSLLVIKLSIIITNLNNKFNDLIIYCGKQSMLILVLHFPIIAVVRDIAVFVANPANIEEFFAIPGFVMIEILCSVIIPVWIAKNFKDKPIIKYFCV